MTMKLPVLLDSRSLTVVALLAAAVAVLLEAPRALAALVGRLLPKRWQDRVANDNEPGLGVSGARFRLV